MSIIKKDAYFVSSTGKDNIHCCVWQDEEKAPKGIFQIAHGVSEYIERYDEFARFMASNGFIVCGNDHLGHGLSARTLGDLGFFAEEDGDIRLVDDMHILSLIMKRKYPELPLALFGHSMGSFVVRLTFARYDDYDALVACGTGGAASGSGLGIALTKTIKKLKGGRAHSKLLYALVFGTYNKKFGKTGSSEWLTRDTDMLAVHDADKLCDFEFTVSALLDLIRLNREANSKKWFEAVDKEKPVLLIAGTDDPVGNYGKGVKEVYDRLAETGHNVKIKLYEGARHEILNETNRDEVNKDLTDFIRSVTEG